MHGNERHLMASVVRNYWLLVPMALVVLAAFCALVMSLGMALGAFYHPRADGSAFAEERTNIAVAFLLFSIVIFVLQTVFLPRMTRRLAGASALGFGAFYGAALAIGSALTVQPDSYVQYVGEQPYLVPRHYNPRGDVDPGPEAGFAVEICMSTGVAIYAEKCRAEIGFPDSARVGLVRRPLTDAFEVSQALINHGITFEGDAIAPLTMPVASETWPFDGFEGISIGGRTSVGAVHMLINRQRSLMLTADCHTGKYCTIQMATSEGNLRFPSRGGTRNPLKWYADAKPFRQLIESWRCLSPKCLDQLRE